MEKPDPCRPSLPLLVTINGFQVLLSSITCLSSCRTQGEGICLTLPPPSIHASSNQQMTHKTLIPLLVPWVKSGLKTPVQCWFSLELVHCSNSVSHSNKLYFPLILSHVEILFQPTLGPQHCGTLLQGHHTSQTI